MTREKFDQEFSQCSKMNKFVRQTGEKYPHFEYNEKAIMIIMFIIQVTDTS